MNDVVRENRSLTDLMTQIWVASREQTPGIAQVGEATKSLEQNARQNVALVRDSASASRHCAIKPINESMSWMSSGVRV